MKSHTKSVGFTLIEILMTMTIVGVLAGVAFPAYQGQVRKARRADAEGALLSFANAMERFFTANNTYLGAAGTKDSPTATGAPWIFAGQAPLEGSKKYYNLTINEATATTYILYATPIDSSPQAHDRCGTLTLTNSGVKDMEGEDDGVQVKDCW